MLIKIYILNTRNVKNIIKLYQMIRYVKVNTTTTLGCHKRTYSRQLIVSQTVHGKQKILYTASKCQLKVNTILLYSITLP